jgi:hypothetical protein
MFESLVESNIENPTNLYKVIYKKLSLTTIEDENLIYYLNERSQIEEKYAIELSKTIKKVDENDLFYLNMNFIIKRISNFSKELKDLSIEFKQEIQSNQEWNLIQNSFNSLLGKPKYKLKFVKESKEFQTKIKRKKESVETREKWKKEAIEFLKDFEFISRHRLETLFRIKRKFLGISKVLDEERIKVNQLMTETIELQNTNNLMNSLFIEFQNPNPMDDDNEVDEQGYSIRPEFEDPFKSNDQE